MPIPWPVHLIIVFSGKHNRIGDFIDNVPGAIADALVKAEILRADNGKAAPGAIYHLAHSQADVVARVAIAPQCSFREMADQIVEIADFLEAESA